MEEKQENTEPKEFTIERKGYSKEEVDNFISDMNNKLETSEYKVFNLEKDVSELNIIIEDYKKIEKDLRDALVLLKESERDTLVRTTDEVSIMMKNAESKSEEIINKAENDAKSTRDTLLFLKEQQEIFVTRLKIIIDSQEGMLNDFRAGDNSVELRKTMAEAAAFKAKSEMNIDAILEKLL